MSDNDLSIGRAIHEALQKAGYECSLYMRGDNGDVIEIATNEDDLTHVTVVVWHATVHG